MSAINGATETTAPPGSALETLRVFLKLGLTSFGGPAQSTLRSHARYRDKALLCLRCERLHHLCWHPR